MWEQEWLVLSGEMLDKPLERIIEKLSDFPQLFNLTIPVRSR